MPGKNAVHVDAVLSNISVQYKNTGFVGMDVLPILKVKKESGKYFEYVSNERFKIPETLRAPRSTYKRIDWGVLTSSYATEEHGLEDVIDDRERDNADAPLDLDVDSTEITTDQLLLGYEQRVVNLVTSTANITQNVTLTGANQWNDPNSDPIRDIKLGRLTINAATGKIPNTLIVSMEVFEDLKIHGELIDRIKYTQKGILTVDLLASLFEVERVLVSYSMYETAIEGQTSSLSRLWGKDCLLTYSERTPGLKKVSLGYTFQSRVFQTETYREEKAKSDIIRVSHIIDEKLMAASCGYLIKNAVA